jgi:tetratricopeptide (TPR) repeat protein
VIRTATAAALALALAMIAPACGGDHSRAELPQLTVNPESSSPTDQSIAKAQGALQKDPNDDEARLSLAVAFLQKVRETADPSLYVKAQGLLDDLRKRHPTDPRVAEAAATLALAQHRFENAHQLGEQALRLAPGSATAYGILVDADNELGRYDDALRATQAMVDARPTLESYARVSYARELRGDYPGAIEAMQEAVASAGTSSGENVAYVETLLGQLLLTTHDILGAQSESAAALLAFPGFAAAHALQAQILVARGRYADAAAVLDKLVEIQPLPQYAISLGDDLTAEGRTAEAARAYALVDVISKLFVVNGVRLDLETALYDADHHPGAHAVAEARRALAARPSALAHDVLAWNLYRVGRLDEAAAESEKALALGSRDPQEQYHAAVIAAARGDDDAARSHLRIVLAENPRFNARLIPDIDRLEGQLGL